MVAKGDGGRECSEEEAEEDEPAQIPKVAEETSLPETASRQMTSHDYHMTLTPTQFHPCLV